MNMYCPSCGKPIKDQEANFCSHCGAKIKHEKYSKVDIDKLPEDRIDLREGLTKRNKGFHQYTKWGKRKKAKIDWDMEK